MSFSTLYPFLDLEPCRITFKECLLSARHCHLIAPHNTPTRTVLLSLLEDKLSHTGVKWLAQAHTVSRGIRISNPRRPIPE